MSIGAANSYSLVDGGWSSRKSQTRGLWVGYVSPGMQVASTAAMQGVFQARAFRNLIVPNPAKTGETLTRNSNEFIARLKIGSPRGSASYEISQSRFNAVGPGNDGTTRRRGYAFEWKVTQGVWLVSSAGKETVRDSGGAGVAPSEKTTSFVTTNLRFGGNPQSAD